MTIPFDPDFDQPLASITSAPRALSPKIAFFLGLALAVGGVATIGFFILLSLLVKS